MVTTLEAAASRPWTAILAQMGTAPCAHQLPGVPTWLALWPVRVGQRFTIGLSSSSAHQGQRYECRSSPSHWHGGQGWRAWLWCGWQMPADGTLDSLQGGGQAGQRTLRPGRTDKPPSLAGPGRRRRPAVRCWAPGQAMPAPAWTDPGASRRRRARNLGRQACRLAQRVPLPCPERLS